MVMMMVMMPPAAATAAGKAVGAPSPYNHFADHEVRYFDWRCN